MSIRLASEIFLSLGCKRASVPAFLRDNRVEPLALLLGARLCELWHDDWENWIITEGPLPEGSAPYFEGECPDEAVLETWLSLGRERLNDAASFVLAGRLSRPIGKGEIVRAPRRAKAFYE